MIRKQEQKRFMSVKRVNTSTYGVIYAIKYQGTPQAYRLMWALNMVGDNQSVTDANGTRYRAYVTIARFPCGKDDDLNINTCHTVMIGSIPVILSIFLFPVIFILIKRHCIMPVLR